MSGKIFPGSANIYEDQAKILFDYYRRTAEHIVEQEMALEKQVAVAREEEVQFTEELKRKSLIEKVCYGAAALLLILMAVVAFRSGSNSNNYAGMLLGLLPLGYGIYILTERKKLAARIVEIQTTIGGFETAHKDIPRDFKVHRLGIAYIPVAGRVAFEGKSFLIDYTGTEIKKEFKLSTVRNNDVFAGAVNGLEDLLKKVPIVEDSTEVEQISTDQYSRSIQQIPYYGYFASLDHKLRTVTGCLNDLSTSSVELPVIFPDTKYARFLSECGTDTPEKSVVFQAFDIRSARRVSCDFSLPQQHEEVLRAPIPAI